MSAGTEKWALTRLGDICEFKYGKSLPETARAGGDISVFGSNGVVGAHNSALTEGPTIVIGRKGSHGEVNFSPASCWPIDTTYYVDHSATKADIRWLFHRLCGAGLNQMNRAAAVPGLNREDAYRVEILLPPLEEQRRIAAILDQAETLRAQRRTALALLDRLTQSLFLDMFGESVTNPKGWQLEKLGKLTSKMGSGSTPTGGDAAYKTEGISLIRSLNVHDGQFKYKNLAYIDQVQAAKLSNVQVAEGDVFLNITGASVARVCRAPADVLPARVNQHVMIVRPSAALNGVFLERMLLSDTMKRALLQIGGAGATREAITKAQAEESLVPLPPLPLQQTFATRIASNEALKATHRRALAALDALFASLQQRAFAGEL